MRRVVSTVLVGLGAFLIMAAFLVKFYALPTLATVPADYESTTTTTARGAQIFDAASLAPKTTDLAISTYTIADTEADAPEGDVVWVSRSSIVDAGVSGATCDPAVDPDLPGCFRQTSERAPFDAKSGEAVDCAECGSWVEESYVDGDAYAVRQVDVTREGQVFKAPFGMDKSDLQWWDSASSQATTMVYQGTEDIDGLETYKYTQTIEPTQVGTQDLPGSVFDVEDDTVTATTMYGMVRTIWFEPTTGSPVDRVEERNQYFEYDGVQVPAFVGTIEYSSDSVADAVETGSSNSFLLGGMVWLFPLVMIVLGLILIGLGVRVGRRGKGSTGEHADDRTLVNA